MAILKEEVRFVDPNATLPSDDAISAVGHRYALKSPEARAVLDPILAAADKANVLVPAALREAQASPEAAPEKPVEKRRGSSKPLAWRWHDAHEMLSLMLSLLS